VGKQFNRLVRANTVVIGRLGMAGGLHKVGGIALKLEAVAREGMRQTNEKPARERRTPVVMHVLITPEHLDNGMPIDDYGAPVMLPEELWKYLHFYRVRNSVQMLKILFHPADERGKLLFCCLRGGGGKGPHAPDSDDALPLTTTATTTYR
jgi:hypothetical protein